MKNLFYRMLLILTAFFSGTAFAQNSSAGIHAFFKKTESETKSAIQSGSLVFFISGIETDQQLKDFINKAQPYSKTFNLTVSAAADGKKECKAVFSGKADMKWLQRFFLAASVADIEQNGMKKSVDDFFKLYI